MIGMEGERESGNSMLPACLKDDDDDDDIQTKVVRKVLNLPQILVFLYISQICMGLIGTEIEAGI